MKKNKKTIPASKKQRFRLRNFFKNWFIEKLIVNCKLTIENYFKVPVHTKARYHLFGVFVIIIVLILVIIFFKKTLLSKRIVSLINYYKFKKEKEIDLGGLLFAIDNGGKEFLLVDLRKKQDFERCHFKNAVNLSLSKAGDFSQKIKQLTENKKEIIVYGERGSDQTVIDLVLKLLDEDQIARALSFGWEEWRYIYGRSLFEKGFDLDKYVEPEGCMNYVNSYPVGVGPMPEFPNGIVPPPIMPGQ